MRGCEFKLCTSRPIDYAYAAADKTITDVDYAGYVASSVLAHS
ncbi:MAG TPA: hypothetical protein VMW22_07970 [Candidatus Desulfaltia sp.]|nr:hypothetical protein [Candidatus Desulfaltia sp.]